MSITNFKELVAAAAAMEEKTRIVVVNAQDEHTLDAIVRATKDGIINPILVGDAAKISEIITHEGDDPAKYEIIPAASVDESLAVAVKLIQEGKGNVLMKGKLQTGEMMKAVVNKENNLRTGKKISLMGFYEIPSYHKLFAVSDQGMNTYPDVQGKKDILENAVNVLHAMGIENPKVGVLAAVENVNPKMPECVDAAALKEMNEKGEITGCVVEGPISFDLAMDPEAAPIKGYVSPVAGDADLLIVPDIASGNILVKALTVLGKAETAGMVVGAKVPIVLTSRAATTSDKYYSIALAAYVAKNY